MGKKPIGPDDTEHQPLSSRGNSPPQHARPLRYRQSNTKIQILRWTRSVSAAQSGTHFHLGDHWKEFSEDRPITLKVVGLFCKAHFEIYVDEQLIGMTSVYQPKRSSPPSVNDGEEIAEYCINHGHSSGGFRIPAGRHMVHIETVYREF